MEKNYKHGHGGADPQHKEDQALFKALLDQHTALERQTVKIDKGIIATTTSEHPGLVKTLQKHVVGMEKRFGMNRAIRSWDPLFVALFEYKEEIKMSYKAIPNGVEATLTTENPKLIELIHAHDATLHGFVNEGFAAGGRESPKPSWLE